LRKMYYIEEKLKKCIKKVQPESMKVKVQSDMWSGIKVHSK